MSDWVIKKPFGLSENWPKTEDGEAVPPEYIEYFTGSQAEVDLAVNLLRAYGIPVFCAFPNNGSFGKVIMGASGTGTVLYVPQTMAEEARDILQAQAVPEDGAEAEEEET